MKRNVSVLLAVTFLTLTACAWVKLTPAGEKVRVLESAPAANCTRIGRTTVSEKAKIGIYRRDPQKVKQELIDLARNSAAADFQGDTIVPITEIEDGQQTFAVYKCTR